MHCLAGSHCERTEAMASKLVKSGLVRLSKIFSVSFISSLFYAFFSWDLVSIDSHLFTYSTNFIIFSISLLESHFWSI